MKTCPFCAEEIKDAAIKCKHCGSKLTSTPGPQPQLVIETPKASNNKMITAVIAAICVVILIAGSIVLGSRDNSKPSLVVGDFFIAAKKNDVNTAGTKVSKDYLTGLSLKWKVESIYNKSLEGVYLPSPDSVLITGDKAVERVNWSDGNVIETITIHLNKTFWGWKITGITE